MRAIRLVVASLAVLVTACGGASSDKSDSSSSTAAGAGACAVATTTNAAAGTTPALIDIVTCEVAGGTGTSTGTIENTGDTATAYHLEIGFYDSAETLRATGSTDTETVAPGASAEWTVSATGISEAEPDCHTVKVSGAAGGTDATTVPAAAGDDEFPCDLFDTTEIGQLAGNPLDPGDYTTNPVSEDDKEWTAHVCAWDKLGSEDSTEVILAVSRSADFPGAVLCPPLAPSEPVVDLGTSAVWSYTDPGTTETVGTLRVCTDDALVDVTVSGTVSGAAQLAVAKKVAQGVLDQL